MWGVVSILREPAVECLKPVGSFFRDLRDFSFEAEPKSSSYLKADYILYTLNPKVSIFFSIIPIYTPNSTPKPGLVVKFKLPCSFKFLVLCNHPTS